MDQRDLGRLEQAVEDLTANLREHVDRQDTDKEKLNERLDEMSEQIRCVRTEHVIVRAGATTVVKVVIWSAAVIGGGVTAWNWVKSHVTFHP